MPYFAWNPQRRGFRFWFVVLSGWGLLQALLALLMAKVGGEEAIRQEYGLPLQAVVLTFLAGGVLAGTAAGFLNRWVASRLASCLTGVAAALPLCAAILALKLGSAGKLTAFNLVAGSTLLAFATGGMAGAILYRSGRPMELK